jgi:3-dehydroquinate dehydratase-1
MRPKICIPIVASLRDAVIREASQINELPVEMVEWRMDFYAG